MKTTLPKYAAYFLLWAGLMAILLMVCSCSPSYHQKIRNRQKAYKKGYVRPVYVDNVNSSKTGMVFPSAK